jgi:hypothetical protein
MSVRLLRSDLGFAFAFRCDGGCSRPEIIALTVPAGWEALPTDGGGLVHRCPDCHFWTLVEALEADFEWREAPW